MSNDNQVMFLTKLSVHREGAYSYSGKADPGAPLNTTIEVQGAAGKVEMKLPPHVGERVVALIADELAAHAKRVAEAMTAEFLNASALPAAAKTPAIEG